MKRLSLLSVPVAAVLFAALVLVPAAHAQSVKADYDKRADFSKYKTFAFKKGTDAPTPFAQERIVNAIASQLKARGMSQSETADILVYTHVQLSTEQRVDTSYLSSLDQTAIHCASDTGLAPASSCRARWRGPGGCRPGRGRSWRPSAVR